jgi:hypothetical protein
VGIAIVVHIFLGILNVIGLVCFNLFLWRSTKEKLFLVDVLRVDVFRMFIRAHALLAEILWHILQEILVEEQLLAYNLTVHDLCRLIGFGGFRIGWRLIQVWSAGLLLAESFQPMRRI